MALMKALQLQWSKLEQARVDLDSIHTGEGEKYNLTDS